MNESGTISLPQDYRGKWVHLGSWAITDEDAPAFHDVYAEPEAVEAYRKSGVFPDGASLVKEIRAAQSDTLTTGEALWAGEIQMWFVMVKGSKGRFKGNKNWGDGWGWALFKAADPRKNTSSNYKVDCIGCHTPVKKTDWIYTYGYPTLKSR